MSILREVQLYMVEFGKIWKIAVFLEEKNAKVEDKTCRGKKV